LAVASPAGVAGIGVGDDGGLRGSRASYGDGKTVRWRSNGLEVI
jgi:hypothetical protein